MKFLTFSDVHADMGLLKKLVKRAQQDDIDFVICAGDFTVFENYMACVLKEMDKMGKPVFTIPGNHETPGRLVKEFKKYKNLVPIHNTLVREGGVTILGWGTDGFARHSDEFRHVAREWRKLLNKDDKRIILVTHAPPYKTKLDEMNGAHVGNADVRAEIERIKPRMAISGHIHENEGRRDKIGNTTLVNSGAKGKVISID